MLSLVLWSGCIAEGHEPPDPREPGAADLDAAEWQDADPGATGEGAVSDAPQTGAGPIERGDPRALPQLDAVAWQAAYDLTQQELEARKEPLVRAELSVRQAELLLVRAGADDRRRAIRLLGQVAAEPSNTNYQRLDDVLFYLAYEAFVDQDEKRLKRATFELIKNYPMSDWIPEAYLLFGDFFYRRGEFDAAAQLYAKTVQFKETDAALFGAYRWAWSLLAEHPDRALERFVTAIQLSGQRTTPDAARVLAAARRDMPRAYAVVGKASKAHDFFRKFGRGPNGQDESVAMLLALVDVYRDRGQTREATYICDGLPKRSQWAECAGLD